MGKQKSDLVEEEQHNSVRVGIDEEADEAVEHLLVVYDRDHRGRAKVLDSMVAALERFVEWGASSCVCELLRLAADAVLMDVRMLQLFHA